MPKYAISFFAWWKRLSRYENIIVGLKESQTTPMSQQQVLKFFENIEAL